MEPVWSRQPRPRPAALGLGVCAPAPHGGRYHARPRAARRRGRGYLRCSYHAATVAGGLTTGATILRGGDPGRAAAGVWAAHPGRFACSMQVATIACLTMQLAFPENSDSSPTVKTFSRGARGARARVHALRLRAFTRPPPMLFSGEIACNSCYHNR